MQAEMLNGDDDGGWGALQKAGRELVARGGLRNLSFRSVAAASGWTLGEINYRIGKKEQLIDILTKREREQYSAFEDKWLARLAGLPQFDGPMLATIVAAYLDEIAANHHVSGIFWEEMLLEAGVNASIRPAATSWINDRKSFWWRLLQGRHEKAEFLARILVAVSVEEQMYTIVLGDSTDYRLLRDIGLRRLCDGLLSDTSPDIGVLFEDLQIAFFGEETIDFELKGSAAAIAAMAGQLMRKKGLSAVTHRAVAAGLGVSTSAVAHHFRTHMDLIQGGNAALYGKFLSDPDIVHVVRRQLAITPSDPGGVVDPNLEAAELMRAMHILVLAAARDPKFIPLAARRRRDRGRTSIRWIGETFDRPDKFDRCSAQMVSMAFGGELLFSQALGLPYEGRSPQMLADLIALSR